MSKVKTVAAAGAGFLAGYLLDPDMGRTRRARLSDQASSKVRGQFRRLASFAQYQVGVTKGIVHDTLKPLRGAAPVDDAKLANRVRSQAVGPWSRDLEEPHNVEVEVIEGRTVISGEVPSKKEHRRLLELVTAVEGVDQIDDQLAVV